MTARCNVWPIKTRNVRKPSDFFLKLFRIVDSDMQSSRDEVSMRERKAVSRFWINVMVVAALFAAPMTGSVVQAEQAADDKGKSDKMPGDEILGEWWTEGREGRVTFARYKNGEYRGTTACCETGLKDVNNPKESLRSRSTVGIVIIWGLKYDGDGEFSGGHVYNPRDGKTYGMNVEVIDKETVKIRGFLGISLLGQSQVWKRYHKGETQDQK